MKSKLLFLSFLGTLSLSAVTAPIAMATSAKDKAPRWFEVEVILFEQLGDKKLLKEQFPDHAQLPSYANYFDLLTPYLQPDITSLKLQLAKCEPVALTEIKTDESTAFIPLKSLTDIEEQSVDEELIDTLVESTQHNAEYSTEINSNKLNSNEVNPYEISEQNLEVSNVNQTLNNSDEINKTASIVTDTEFSLATETIDEEVLKGLTEQQVILLNAAEQEFAEIQFIESPNYPYFPKRELCRVSERIAQQANAKVNGTSDDLPTSTFLADSFPVDKVPTTIKASGLRSDSEPYLISKDSLLLKDVITRLKWSKNFRPLLHLGWRQIGITRKKAVPLKIFAGEHLEQTYQHALNEHAQTQATLEAQQLVEQQALLTLTEESGAIETNSKDEDQLDLQGIKQTNSAVEQTAVSAPQRLTLAQQQIEQLKAIFEQLALIDDDSLNELGVEQFLANASSKTNNETSLTAEVDDPVSLSNIELPTQPIQPWLLDGFFKVHLDHYLYITADLNIVSEAMNSNSDKITKPQKAFKAINFSQNRRVISGEVHYFDHPYIGMVVQIRRFDPSKADDEAVTQAIR